MACLPEIAWTVIGFNAIYMVYLFIRPLAIEHSPNNTMSFYSAASQSHNSVTILAGVSGKLPFLYFRKRACFTFPAQFACLNIKTKQIR